MPVGASTGTTPPTVEGMAACILDFVDALGLAQFDLFGFSMGGMVAQAFARTQSSRIRRLILAGTSPRGGEPTPYRAEVAQRASGKASLDDFLWLFFGHSETGKAAGRAFWDRRNARTVDRDPPSGRDTIMAQVAAGRDWLQPHGARFEDLAATFTKLADRRPAPSRSRPRWDRAAFRQSVPARRAAVRDRRPCALEWVDRSCPLPKEGRATPADTCSPRPAPCTI